MWGLIQTIFLLEYKRLRIRIWGLAVLGLLGGCIVAAFRKREIPNTIQLPPGLENEFLALLPLFSMILSLYFLILVFLATFPFRGKIEWEDGHFQMVRLSDFSAYRIELLRFAFFVLVAVLSFLTVTIPAFLSVSFLENLGRADLTNLVTLLVYWFICIVPLILGINLLVSATRQGYFAKGIGYILGIAITSGGGLTYLLFLRGIVKIFQKESALLGSLEIEFSKALNGFATNLPLEIPLIIFLVAIFSVIFSGRISQEIEA